MNIFFGTFFKVLATLFAISFFLLILVGIINLIENDKSADFKFVKGNLNSENTIVILNLNGPIIPDSLGINNISTFQFISPSNFKKKLETIEQLKPKLIIISINSPGGTVSASYEIFNILKKFRLTNNIKSYFHTKEMLASGAYWFALSGDKIFGSYGSLVGSIGVKGPDWIYYDKPIALSSGIFGKSIETENGIKIYSQSAGKSKDLLNPFRKPTEEELDKLQLIVDHVYENFLSSVSNKRKIEKNIIKNELGGMIYSSTIAKNNFLIDDVLSLDTLIENEINNSGFVDYKIYENTTNNFSIFNNLLMNLFNIQKLNEKPLLNNNLCNTFKSNITSISNNYFLNC